MHLASVDIIIPVFNEERVLADSVRRLHDFLTTSPFPFDWTIVIVDNASTDDTNHIAYDLARSMARVDWIPLDVKGRGLAVRAGWEDSEADVVAYMDVDLSTDLRAMLPLVAPLVSGHSDIAIGTRWHPSARVVRGPKRKAISWCFNHLLQWVFGAHFSDAMCGFKAMRTDVARRLLPFVQDNEWFFDAELLVLAERSGLRIHEVPLDWVDDPDSRVDVMATARANLRGIRRLNRTCVSSC